MLHVKKNAKANHRIWAFQQSSGSLATLRPFMQDEKKSPCVLQDFFPFGAAALLPLTPIHNHAKQGKG